MICCKIFFEFVWLLRFKIINKLFVVIWFKVGVYKLIFWIILRFMLVFILIIVVLILVSLLVCVEMVIKVIELK